MYFLFNFHQAANFNLDSFESSLWSPHTGLDREKDKEKHGLNGETSLLCPVFLCLKTFRLFLPFIDFSLYLFSSVIFVDVFIGTTAILSDPVLFSLFLNCIMSFWRQFLCCWFIHSTVLLDSLLYSSFLYFFYITVYSFTSDFSYFRLNTI